MFQSLRPIRVVALMVLAASATNVRADDDGNAYAVAPLVSNIAGAAAKQDTVLQNAWGVAFSPGGSPFWVNDNVTGCSTLYTGNGTKIPLQVSIPLPGNLIAPGSCQPVDPNHPPSPTPAAPTGIVWNPSSAFLVPESSMN